MDAHLEAHLQATPKHQWLTPTHIFQHCRFGHLSVRGCGEAPNYIKWQSSGLRRRSLPSGNRQQAEYVPLVEAVWQEQVTCRGLKPKLWKIMRKEGGSGE